MKIANCTDCGRPPWDDHEELLACDHLDDFCFRQYDKESSQSRANCYKTAFLAASKREQGLREALRSVRRLMQSITPQLADMVRRASVVAQVDAALSAAPALTAGEEE